MIKLHDNGAFLVNGCLSDNGPFSKEEGRTKTIAYNILKDHNVSGNMDKLQIKFDKLTSHDITFVASIQTALASCL